MLIIVSAHAAHAMSRRLNCRRADKQVRLAMRAWLSEEDTPHLRRRLNRRPKEGEPEGRRMALRSLMGYLFVFEVRSSDLAILVSFIRPRESSLEPPARRRPQEEEEIEDQFSVQPSP
jgi:hypothetical protein